MILKVITLKNDGNGGFPVERTGWWESKTIHHRVVNGHHKFELENGRIIDIEFKNDKFKSRIYIVDNGKTIESFNYN